MKTHEQEVLVGDRVVVAGPRVGDPGRAGEITAVLGAVGHEHYQVRWSDGRETIIFPGADTTIRHDRKRATP